MELPKGSLISYMANMVKAKGGINLAQGIPAFEPPQDLIKQLQKVSALPVHQYAPGAGNNELLELIASKYKAYDISKKNLLITNGATESISLIFTLLVKQLKGNFSALAFDPVYESYKHLPRIFNIPFLAHPLKGNLTIDFFQLEKTIVEKHVKIIFVASPGNPLGKIWNAQEQSKLLALAEKHQAYLIWDAVYSELYFDNKPDEPLHNLSPHLFYVNAFSKQLSITGWRLGYLIMDESHHESMLDIHDYIGLCAPSVLQQAVANYLKDNHFGKNYCANLRKQLTENYKLLAHELKALGFTIHEAQGGYFIWCSLPENLENGFEFAMNLYNSQKVACVPGIHFSKNGINHVRFNIAQKPEVLMEAIERIKSFIKNN